MPSSSLMEEIKNEENEEKEEKENKNKKAICNNSNNIVLVFDTETTGLVDSRIIQLSFILYDIEKAEIIFFSEKNKDYILLPEFYNSENINSKWLDERMQTENELSVLISNFENQKRFLSNDEYKKQKGYLEENGTILGRHIIPFESTISHHIFDSTIYKYGRDLNIVMNEFIKYFYMADIIVGHNINFDIKMICIELIHLLDEKYIDLTCEERKAYIQLFYDLIDNVNDVENIKNPNFHKERTKLLDEMIKKNGKHDMPSVFEKNKRIIECTMKRSIIECKLRQSFEYKKMYSTKEIAYLESSPCHIWKLYKPPKLLEAHKILFGQHVKGELHNSRVDVCVTLRVFLKLYKNIDICNYYSTLNKDNHNIYCIINPEDISDPKDFPIQLFFKKMDKLDSWFYIDNRPCFKQTKEMMFKTIENRLREIKKELKIILPNKILEMKMINDKKRKVQNTSQIINGNIKSSVEIVDTFIKEENKMEYSKINPRRNPRRSTRK